MVKHHADLKLSLVGGATYRHKSKDLKVLDGGNHTDIKVKDLRVSLDGGAPCRPKTKSG